MKAEVTEVIKAPFTDYTSFRLYKSTGENRAVSPAFAFETSVLNDGINITIFLCKDSATAKSIYKDISFFSSFLLSEDKNKQKNRNLKSLKDIYPVKNKKSVFLCEEIIPASVLYELQNNNNIIIVLTPASFIAKVPVALDVSKSVIKLKNGQNINRDELIDSLLTYGFDMVAEIEDTAQFSVRGEIIDIYGNWDDKPVRIDFFDDEIQDIRYFNLNTQRSIKKTDSFTIFPIKQDIYERNSNILSILPPGSSIFIEDSETIAGARYPGILYTPPPAPLDTGLNATLNGSFYKKLEEDSSKVVRYFYLCERFCLLTGTDLKEKFTFGDVAFLRCLKEKQGELNLKRAASFFKSLLAFGYIVILVAKKEMYAQRIKEIFDSIGISEGKYKDKGVFYIATSEISGGFMARNRKILVFTEEELFKEHINLTDEAFYKRGQPDFFEDFRELNTGDYVVHEDHGIAKFIGIKTLSAKNTASDYFELVYAGGDKVYVPAEKIYLIHKYISSSDEKAPELSRLGSKSWEKAKKKAKKAVEEVAEDLKELYARRKSETGFAFSKEDEIYREFEEDFEYEETEDQAKAIRDVLSDMSSNMPMDRLICGDTGYGKTEVAIRAAFKAVMDGKQAILLAPTTLLVEQHYLNFKKRFEKYPVKVACLSRFIRKKEEKEILSLLEKGKIDILIGTHKLLSGKIKFRDPGLFIIDEEQKFGAFQKEKIKKMKSSIDVLVLSAMPIPRTLYFSISGIRDLSIINTPPAGRKNVVTEIIQYDETIIKDYVYRELKRGGQVYFVDNRISHLDGIYERFKTMLPDINIGIAHGRLTPGQLEEVMHRFYQKKYDMLLSTAIIESGIDNPNVNTIIINEAEKFGLSQLYQLRGRVGRSHLQAYCLLTVHIENLSREQAKRLAAIQEYNELGSGFRLAMADLEIRGAGNILGGAQSGHIESVGLEMCMQMLEDEINKIKGQVLPPSIFPEVNIDAGIYIPDSYIQDSRLKLIFYRKLSQCGSVDEVMNVKNELEDRFGRLPEEAANLISVSELKIYMKNVKVERIEIKKENCFNIKFHESAKVLSSMIISFVNDKAVISDYIINFSGEYELKIRLKKAIPFKVKGTASISGLPQKKDNIPVHWGKDAVLEGSAGGNLPSLEVAKIILQRIYGYVNIL